MGRPFGSDRLGWSSAKRLQEVAEPGVSDEYRMGPSHVRLRFGEEIVVAQVGIALRVDEERVSDAAPVQVDLRPVWRDPGDGPTGLDGGEPVDGALYELDALVLEQALVHERERLAVRHVGVGLDARIVVEQVGRRIAGPALLEHEQAREL